MSIDKSEVNMEEFKYLIDSRDLTDKEIEAEKKAILLAREARFRQRSGEEKKMARLLKLKLEMEDYLQNPESISGRAFSKFLQIYVDILYEKRKHFASDLSIPPIVLSQVLNQHRAPQEAFIRRLIIHTRGSYENICAFGRDIWPRIYFQDKVSQFLSTQDQVNDSEAKYVTLRRINLEE